MCFLETELNKAHDHIAVLSQLAENKSISPTGIEEVKKIEIAPPKISIEEEKKHEIVEKNIEAPIEIAKITNSKEEKKKMMPMDSDYFPTPKEKSPDPQAKSQKMEDRIDTVLKGVKYYFQIK